MRSEFEKNRYWIGLFRTDVEFNALLGEFGRYELNGSRDVDHGYLEAFNSKWEAYARAWQNRQTEVDELQKRVDVLEATLQSERWDKDAGFKIFFKARDTQGQWHGFEKKPEYYEVGGYWMNGGKTIYLQGDEWCDRETAINSLTAVKEQALKGEGCQ